jgi:hypothetical protein
MNYDLIHYFSLTQSREPEPRAWAETSYTSSGSDQKFRLRLHNTACKFEQNLSKKAVSGLAGLHSNKADHIKEGQFCG